jgi:hypothetical protein
MKLLLPVLCVLAAAACNTGEKTVPPTKALFVTDDCALISAIGRTRYDLSRDDPPMRLRLNGEDAPWQPGCDWQGLGFNLVPVAGPEGEAATAGMGEITFHRPRYDVDGALIRTSMAAGGASAERMLCRVKRDEGSWTLDSCGPDPKDVLPPPAAPSPADATPDARIQPPANGEPAVRDATLPDTNPGNTPGPD